MTTTTTTTALSFVNCVALSALALKQVKNK